MQEKVTDFKEVAHTGGRITFTVTHDAEGRLNYSISASHSAPRPATLVAVYAHPDGFACGNVELGGIGQPFNPPPFPHCIVVFMASDSEGQFGHECPQCHHHFRSENIPSHHPLTCPYCGLRGASYGFLTPPQKVYLAHYVEMLQRGLAEVDAGTTKDIVIDMDAITDSVDGRPRPDFYYSSTTQQTQFRCKQCNSFNDIRGRFGYCASCGWRNNAQTLKDAVDQIRSRLNSKALSAEEAVKQAVSEFDSCCRDFMTQLAARVPMKQSRRNSLLELLFHNLDRVGVLQDSFDINLLKGMEGERAFMRMMFSRRHAYEHDGGVATARYVQESGDQATQEGALIRETQENAHRFIGDLVRMTETFETNFHEIFPPDTFCIDLERKRRARLARR